MNEALMHAGGPAALLLLIPLSFAAAAALPGADVRSAWRRALTVGSAALLLALAAVAALAVSGAHSARFLTLVHFGDAGALSLSTRLDAVTGVMLVLVSFIALVILRFSRTYLDGEPGQLRYVRWFAATLAAVTLLVVSNNLLLLALAWIATSLALHQLLTFYAERPQALIAAHKKFLASRLADVCMLSAVAIIGTQLGTLEIDRIATDVAGMTALPAALQVATVLLAAAAAIKCAQLPLHGWLIQVMEAPTPVSALLHAGVVNIGGFLMIRLAPLMLHADLAQGLLVAVGTVTAVIAALVMTTRVSVKVALAWSTCAQMGFMLLQCGLGAWPLALLHLVAHSLYKAHAFLASGSTVEQWRAQALLPAAPGAAPALWLGAAAVCALAVGTVGLAFGASPSHEPALWALATIVALALTPLAVGGTGGGALRLVKVATLSLGVATLYFTAHAAVVHLAAGAGVAAQHEPVRLAIVLTGFGVLFLLQMAMDARPQGTLAQALYPRLFAGLYLDELATRLTFRIWPARLGASQAAPSPSTQVRTQEI
jgi:NAD(P)H-quinone oxidoreductase subunit 5